MVVLQWPGRASRAECGAAARPCRPAARAATSSPPPADHRRQQGRRPARLGSAGMRPSSRAVSSHFALQHRREACLGAHRPGEAAACGGFVTAQPRHLAEIALQLGEVRMGEREFGAAGERRALAAPAAPRNAAHRGAARSLLATAAPSDSIVAVRAPSERAPAYRSATCSSNVVRAGTKASPGRRAAHRREPQAHEPRLQSRRIGVDIGAARRRALRPAGPRRCSRASPRCAGARCRAPCPRAPAPRPRPPRPAAAASPRCHRGAPARRRGPRGRAIPSSPPTTSAPGMPASARASPSARRRDRGASRCDSPAPSAARRRRRPRP